jgi:hypothetical protein
MPVMRAFSEPAITAEKTVLTDVTFIKRPVIIHDEVRRNWEGGALTWSRFSTNMTTSQLSVVRAMEVQSAV